MSVRLIGANPGLTMLDGDDRVAFASVWRVDWSTEGPGAALVLWYAGRTRIVTPTPALGRWLATEFTRHFPEVAGLPWPEPEVTEAPVEYALDLATGLRATAGGIEVEIAEPVDRRLVRVDDFDLGGTPNVLSTVYIPCATGALTVDGVRVPGSPKGFLADAEVWCDG